MTIREIITKLETEKNEVYSENKKLKKEIQELKSHIAKLEKIKNTPVIIEPEILNPVVIEPEVINAENVVEKPVKSKRKKKTE